MCALVVSCSILKSVEFSSCVFSWFHTQYKAFLYIALSLRSVAPSFKQQKRTRLRRTRNNNISPSLWLSSSPLPFIVYISSSLTRLRQQRTTKDIIRIHFPYPTSCSFCPFVHMWVQSSFLIWLFIVVGHHFTSGSILWRKTREKKLI